MGSHLEFDFDYIIIGSGFGGSTSACRLTEKGYTVAVLERGKRWRPQDFPKSNWNVFKFLWMPLLRCFGIQNLSLFKNVLILSGSGVGGGSLVYANTLIQPGDHFYEAPVWKDLAPWREELAPHYETAKRMLGVTKNPKLTAVDEIMKECATELGKQSTFEAVPVGVFFGKPGEEGKTVPDPYFGGKGPERQGCTYCGGCMVGCRFGGKNTLDKNYLYLAEKQGAQVFAESMVYDIRPLPEGGYEVFFYRSTDWWPFKRKFSLKSQGIVLSAGVLGTVDLLFKCRDVNKSLPLISPRLGADVRTNSEAILGVTTRKPIEDKSKDFSHGIAISSVFQADKDTYIEPVRYPHGSSFMRLLAVPMVDGSVDDKNSGFVGGILRVIKFVATVAFHPIDTVRLIVNSDWARRTVILLVMQTLDNKMNLKLGRNWLTLFRKRMTTQQDASAMVPSYIPIGHQVARSFAKRVNGIPQSAINEVTLQVPTTAHILGGCIIGKDRESGVIDKNHEVFGYPRMYVCDGSVIPANLGVNPSLTITALTERCMSRIPEKDASKFLRIKKGSTGVKP